MYFLPYRNVELCIAQPFKLKNSPLNNKGTFLIKWSHSEKLLKIRNIPMSSKPKHLPTVQKGNGNFEEKAKKIIDFSLHNNGIKSFMKFIFCISKYFLAFQSVKNWNVTWKFINKFILSTSERFWPCCVVQQYDGCKSLYRFWSTLLRPQLWIWRELNWARFAPISSCCLMVLLYFLHMTWVVLVNPSENGKTFCIHFVLSQSVQGPILIILIDQS